MQFSWGQAGLAGLIGFSGLFAILIILQIALGILGARSSGTCDFDDLPGRMLRDAGILTAMADC